MKHDPSGVQTMRIGRLALTLHGLWLSIKVALELPPFIPPERIRPLRLFLVDGTLGSISDQIALTFVPLLALAIGASNLQLGLLAAMASFGSALALPASTLLANRSRDQRQPVIILATGLARLSYLALALLPALAPPSAGTTWLLSALIVIWATRSFLSNVVHLVWTAFSVDLVPSAVRGSYLHDRKDFMSLAAILILPIAGLVIWLGGDPLGYQIAGALACAAGIGGLVAFARIPRIPPTESAAARAPAIHTSWKALYGARPLLLFYGISFIWNLSLQLVAPFWNIYLVRGLGATALGVGTLAAISLFFGLASSHVVTRAVNRRGPLLILRSTGLAIALVPLGWTLVTAAWQVAFLNALSGILWAAFNLTAFRALIALAPEAERPSAVKLYQALVFVSAIIGPLAGGIAADAIGFKPIFLISAAGRLLAMSLLWAFVREA
jgi:MFS family permease